VDLAVTAVEARLFHTLTKSWGGGMTFYVLLWDYDLGPMTLIILI